jgi:hypothetical protein
MKKYRYFVLSGDFIRGTNNPWENTGIVLNEKSPRIKFPD